MQDHELDDLLLQARRSVTAASADEARRLALAAIGTTSEEPAPRSVRSDSSLRRRGRLRALPIGIAAALLLAGAGTLTAHQLSIPPFQTLEPGLVRSVDGVPLEFRTDSGTLVTCRAFLEFRGLSTAQAEQVNAMIAEGDWDGYGQELYDGLTADQRAVQEGPGPVGEAAMRDLETRALAAAPGTSLRQAEGPTITGGAISCDYPEGAPGHER